MKVRGDPSCHFAQIDHMSGPLPATVGTELPNLDTARVEAVRLAGEMIAQSAPSMDVGQGWRLEVTDSEDMLLLQMHFVVAVAPAAQGGLIAVEIPH